MLLKVLNAVAQSLMLGQKTVENLDSSDEGVGAEMPATEEETPVLALTTRLCGNICRTPPSTCEARTQRGYRQPNLGWK